VPRFLSPEWIVAFNAALDGVELGSTGTEGSLVASSGQFRVRQVVSAVPPDDRTVQTTLTLDDGHASMSLEDPASAEDADADGTNVVVALPYEVAAAISKGEVHPTQALGTGRIRVRGDLAVLIAGQAVLSGVSEHLAPLQADTTY
jgi:putative sterol carrier protein